MLWLFLHINFPSGNKSYWSIFLKCVVPMIEYQTEHNPSNLEKTENNPLAYPLTLACSNDLLLPQRCYPYTITSCNWTSLALIVGREYKVDVISLRNEILSWGLGLESTVWQKRYKIPEENLEKALTELLVVERINRSYLFLKSSFPTWKLIPPLGVLLYRNDPNVGKLFQHFKNNYIRNNGQN